MNPRPVPTVRVRTTAGPKPSEFSSVPGAGPAAHSSSISVYSLAACLMAAQQFGQTRTWRPPANPMGRTLMELVTKCPDALSVPDIQTLCSFDRGELTRWFAARGFDMQLPDTIKPPTYFGSGAVLDVLGLWPAPGNDYERTLSFGRFPFVSMKSGKHAYRLYAVPEGAGVPTERVSVESTVPTNFIAVLATKRPGEVFCMVPCPMPLSSPVQLASLMRALNQANAEPIEAPQGTELHFPEVKHEGDPDLSCLVEPSPLTSAERSRFGLPLELQWIKQKNRLKLSKDGFRAQSATAAVFRAGSAMPAQPPLQAVIDTPFLCWVARKELAQPLFAAWIAPEDWKPAGDLGTPNAARF